MPKTKEELLKMSKKELFNYNWSKELEDNCSDCSNCLHCSDCSNCLHCSDCSDCRDCSYCSDCSDCWNCLYCRDCSDCLNCWNCWNCSFCYMCRNVKGLKYAICNVEFDKETYEKKIKQLKDEK